MKTKVFRPIGAVLLMFFTGCNLNISNAPIFISPTSATLKLGQTAQFKVTVNGTVDTDNLSWSVNGITGGNAIVGTISDNGLYTAPETAPSPNVVTVKATTQGPNKQGNILDAGISAQVTIVGSGLAPSASISVSPETITPGDTATLGWSSANVDNCTINGSATVNGVTVGTQGSVQVSPSETTSYDLACTGSNGPASAEAQLTVQSSTQGTGVSVSPSTATIASGQALLLTAVVTNDPSGKGVTWSVAIGAPPVPITPLTATYTGPSVTTSTDIVVTATSVADTSVKGTATITVTPQGSLGPPQSGIQPPSININSGASYTFVASITGEGVTSQDFTWSIRASQNVPPDQIGTITQISPNSATYQAADVSELVDVQIVAQSNQFPSVFAYATVAVGP